MSDVLSCLEPGFSRNHGSGLFNEILHHYLMPFSLILLQILTHVFHAIYMEA